MKGIRRLTGGFHGKGKRMALVASRFNERIVDRLLDGAVDCLIRHGVAEADLTVVRVPGAWELPAALDALASGGELDAMVALGVVIRGETPHFDYICNASSAGIARVSSDRGIPIGFGLLTCETSQQAEDRAGGKAGNKGWDAALAALEMSNLLGELRA